MDQLFKNCEIIYHNFIQIPSTCNTNYGVSASVCINTSMYYDNAIRRQMYKIFSLEVSGKNVDLFRFMVQVGFVDNGE